jgi:hypothetical protein
MCTDDLRGQHAVPAETAYVLLNRADKLTGALCARSPRDYLMRARIPDAFPYKNWFQVRCKKWRVKGSNNHSHRFGIAQCCAAPGGKVWPRPGRPAIPCLGAMSSLLLQQAEADHSRHDTEIAEWALKQAGMSCGCCFSKKADRLPVAPTDGLRLLIPHDSMVLPRS